MGLAIADLKNDIDRLLDHVQRGVKLPSNITDAEAAKTLRLIVDIILGPAKTEDESENAPARSILDNGTPLIRDSSVEMGARLKRGGSRQPSRGELGQALAYMLEGRSR